MTVKKPLGGPRLDDFVGPDKDPEVLMRVVAARLKPAINGRYRHWDSLRHMTPPEPFKSVEEWWTSLKFSRAAAGVEVPGFVDVDGDPWSLVMHAELLEYLHGVDKAAAEQIAISEAVLTPGHSRRFLVESLAEEAIRSSQLEGASTTRRVAREMIRSGRDPRTHSERMIFNNYRAMQRVGQIRDEDLTVDTVLELHRIVTDGTLKNPAAAGRVQTPDEERIAVCDRETGAVLHQPPPAEVLSERMQRMCDFANASDDEFLHPVLRSIVLHFWMGYDHPFEDGNGRTARVLFYWSMLRHGYWLTEYLSISKILHDGPTKYARSFLYSEIDDNDLTYFALFQLRVIDRAIESMRAWLRSKMEEVRDVESLVADAGLGLNHRQLALLSHALRHPDAIYTYAGHARSHDVVQATARSDLLGLADQGIVSRGKRGRQHVFRVRRDLRDHLEELMDASNGDL